MEQIIIPQNDHGFDLTFPIQDSSGNAYPLTDYVVKLKVWVPGAPTNLVVNGTCAVTDAPGGICTYTVQSADFAIARRYLAEAELIKSGVVESTRNFMIIVEESA